MFEQFNLNFNMKFYFKPVLSVLALAMLLTYAGCKKGGDPEPSVEEQQLEKLSATWKVGASGDVLLDGNSVKVDGGYENFTLNLSGTPGETTFGYTTGGRPALSAWPSSGTWSFGTDPTQDIVRDPGGTKEIDMTYSVTDTDLEITFQYAGAGEAGKVKGTWVFRLTK
jgi:hypothetical protein